MHAEVQLDEAPDPSCKNIQQEREVMTTTPAVFARCGHLPVYKAFAL